MLAGITQSPELELDQTEAAKIALAVVNVGRHYNMTMSAKALDWTALVMVLGEVYATRFLAMRMRRTEERKAARAGNSKPEPTRTEPRGTANGADPSAQFVDIPGVARVRVN